MKKLNIQIGPLLALWPTVLEDSNYLKQVIWSQQQEKRRRELERSRYVTFKPISVGEYSEK